MTKVQDFLSGLPQTTQNLFEQMFGTMNRFYTVTYLIARNEHLTEQQKPERYEVRLDIIRQIRKKMEAVVDGFGLNGADVVADIASDYFEDYVNYREVEISISNEDFLEIINKVAATN